MQSSHNVKILLAYHKPAELLKTEIFTPIYVGAELTKDKTSNDITWMKENLLSDNTGDNISIKNPNYCELTSQYWAWKNQKNLDNPDYIGFMHYRRHLNFNLNKKYQTNKWGCIDDDYLDGFYLEKYGLNTENIEKIVNQYDIITVEKWNVENAGSKNNYDHYQNSDPKLHIKDYDLALDILEQKYPEYKSSIKEYNNSKYGYYTNIFIMKKTIFNEYCQWLFNILFELEKQVDISKYDFQEARIFGYISEWLFGIWIYHHNKKYKIKELQRTIINRFDFIQNSNAVNICFSADENYICPLNAAIASVLINSRNNSEINIYILQKPHSITKKSKEKTKQLENLRKNSKISFIEIDTSVFKDFPIVGHFSEAMYYRYIISNIFINLKKVLYLDCDLIVKKDITDLYNTNIDKYYVGAVQDIIGKSNQRRLQINKTKKYFYCNSGVLLMNLDLLRNDNLLKKLLQYTAEQKTKLWYPDQDAINVVMENKIKYLDLSWNLQYYYPNTVTDYPPEIFKSAISNPAIIHFIGVDKPWNTGIRRPFGNEYFKYLTQTAFKNKVIQYKIISLFKFIFSYNTKQSSKILIKILGIKISIKKETFKYFFSISKSPSRKHKIIYLLGIKFKIKRRLYPLEQKINSLQWQIDKLKN